MVRSRFSSLFGSRGGRPRRRPPPPRPQPPKPPPSLDPAPVIGVPGSVDPLLDPVVEQAKAAAAAAEIAPHALRQRRRRVTLPRVTRGWSRAIVWSLIGISTGGLIYGFVARIETSVAAAGELRPKGGVGAVTPPFTGIVEQVLVKEGQMVVAQQPLLRLRDLAAQAQLRDLQAIQRLWLQETQVVASQLGLRPAPGDPLALDQLGADTREVAIRRSAASLELGRSIAEMEATRSEVTGLRVQLQINTDLTRRLRRLRDQGGAAQIEVDRQREREESIRTTLNRAIQQLRSAELRTRETSLKGELIPAADRRQLFPRYSNARQQYLEAASKIADLRERISLQTLRAPSGGKVFDLQAKVGETIGTGRPAVRVVPPTALEARIEVSNRDIGLLRRGMKVDLRLDSFPSTEYGSIKAWITRISADALPADAANPQPRFVVTARLSEQFLSRRDVRYKLRPGMAFNGLILLESRPAISLITDRLFSFLDSSRTIR